MRHIFIISLILYSIVARADTNSYFKCLELSRIELATKIPSLPLFGAPSEKIEAWKKIIKSNQTLNPGEKAAIKLFLDQRRVCEKIDGSLRSVEDQPGWFSLELLGSGFINFEQFGRLELDGLNTAALLSDVLNEASRLKDERDTFAKELLRRTEAATNKTVLSCVVESGFDQAVGIEYLLEINEVEKTVKSNRANNLTSVVINEMSIYYKQGDMQTTLSRATGKFTSRGPVLMVMGTCKKIVQRAF